AERLRDERIGAMIVSRDGRTVEGIISERDIAYGLASHGPSVAKLTTADLMTTVIASCTPTDSVTKVANTMTLRRVRHLPVFELGVL
ncbi:CBS domain-containing protein, partial [Acinetobacter baumannii]